MCLLDWFFGSEAIILNFDRILHAPWSREYPELISHRESACWKRKNWYHTERGIRISPCVFRIRFFGDKMIIPKFDRMLHASWSREYPEPISNRESAYWKRKGCQAVQVRIQQTMGSHILRTRISPCVGRIGFLGLFQNLTTGYTLRDPESILSKQQTERVITESGSDIEPQKFESSKQWFSWGYQFLRVPSEYEFSKMRWLFRNLTVRCTLRDPKSILSHYQSNRVPTESDRLVER